MNEVPPMASLGLRVSWGLRLMVMDFRRHVRPAVLAAVAFVVMAGAVVAVAVNVEAPAASGVPQATAQLVAFLRDDIPDATRDELAGALQRLPGVTAVRVLSSDDALARMRAELGDRASVLDEVEEGFLPTSLEISLQPGPKGVGGADALAWRLRRMDGITDVDVLRSDADHRLIAEQARSRRLWLVDLGEAGAVFLAGLSLAILALRRRRADAVVLAGLGFTQFAIAAPASLAGVAAGFGGTLVALGAAHGGLLSLAQSRFFEPRLQLLTLVALALLGGFLGWWGARLPGRRVDELASDM